MSGKFSALNNDEAVQSTNDDACGCKCSAVNLGYWKDSYVNYFVKRYDRKPPEINRGYYARVKGIEHLVSQCLQVSKKECQIISFGAGFDTLYWRLKESGCTFSKFIEFDFPIMTSKKHFLIKKHKQLFEHLQFKDTDDKSVSPNLYTADYFLIGADLRDLNSISNKLTSAGINFDLPTIFIAECVLVYVDVQAISNLLKYLAKSFSDCIFINYEQVNLNDTFGRIMLENLRARGCMLPGHEDCENLDKQKSRFTSNGWDGAKAWTMVEIYNSFMENERCRIESIEMLDEKELLSQLLEHYCISVGWKGGSFENICIQEKS
ncbi:hypothetical protein TKK_0007658 [Trichogramma kaykai]